MTERTPIGEEGRKSDHGRRDGANTTRRPNFATRDGQLAIGGMTVERLAQRVGSTPFFAYDRALLDERIALLRTNLPAAVEISYAVKANPMPALVQHLSGVVDSLDVASGAELRSG